MAQKELNIYQKMLEATSRIGKVAKNLKVGIGQSQYKAVGEADVLDAIKPIEYELGIYSFPYSREIVFTDVLTNVTTNKDGTKSEKNSLFMRIKTVYRFINIDDPNQFIDITTYGDGVDSQDKAPGKAMTYSDKYALLKAYKIETGDDPDQNASQDLKHSAQTLINPPKVEQPPKKMTFDEAVNMKTSKGKPFGELSDQELDYILKNSTFAPYIEAAQIVKAMRTDKPKSIDDLVNELSGKMTKGE